MTDLNNTLLNSSGVADLFSNNLSCENALNGEILTESVEKPQSDIQNPLPTVDLKDPNTFILLLAHVVKEMSNYQATTEIAEEPQQSCPESINSESPESEDVIEEKSEEQSIIEMENNVAVSWINSQYYQQEIENKRINLKQEYNPSDMLNGVTSPEQNEEKPLPRPVQVKETQIQHNELISKNDLLSEEIQQKEIQSLNTQQLLDRQSIEQQALIVEAKNNLLQDAEQFLNSEIPQISNNILLKSVEPVGNNKDSPNTLSHHINNKESMTSNLRLEYQFGDLENSTEEKKTSQTVSFQSLTDENGITSPPLSTTSAPSLPAIENSDETKLQLMGHVLTSEVRVDVPMENRAPIMDIASQTQSLVIPIEVNTPEWSKQFSEHIIWLGQQQGVKSAVIKLNPEDLGPLEINIKVMNDSASVNIITNNHHIRDIIDQSLPRLQAMMAEQGLNLSEVQIDSDANPRQFSQQNNSGQEQLTHTFEDEIGVTPLKNKGRVKGLVDYFA
ncbi:flagellar hook-length control protein FliK [Legionella steigerwaltii]|uniref:Flagellar hook-length control protein n=1 Tax=Legionella steigerwaltii TaxID=460 RepID=A0A378L853_9GAMM|nr:flagellar hook-length control protein FliK [Legionella steigerwaltii]KTD77693.1 putative flagellar hook-length control protein [Legionella steigerwaltii]STY23003.1 flagellar hook-length control protein FliK [Legionella steigerwaltii]